MADLRGTEADVLTRSERVKLQDCVNKTREEARSYESKANRRQFKANVITVAQLIVGTVVALTALLDDHLQGTATVTLGGAVVLLEGFSRLFKPSHRAANARRAAFELNREIDLLNDNGEDYAKLHTLRQRHEQFGKNVRKIRDRAHKAEETELPDDEPDRKSSLE